MGAHHANLVRDVELGQGRSHGLDLRPVAVAAHQDAHQGRCVFRHGYFSNLELYGIAKVSATARLVTSPWYILMARLIGASVSAAA